MNQKNETNENHRLDLIVSNIDDEAVGIRSFELVDKEGRTLPCFTAGSHIDIEVPGGYLRQYSLSNDPAETHRYVISVLRDTMGRGGSQALHDNVEVGDSVRVSLPRNNFQVSDFAEKHILIAGGIGVTPLKSMAHHLLSKGESFDLHYCAKSSEHAAFKECFKEFMGERHVVIHYDNGNPADGLDIGLLLEEFKAGHHVYYCGPSGFMDACASAAKHWPKKNVHFEHFKAPDVVEGGSEDVESAEFKIKVNGTGDVFSVSESESIADVLTKNGYDLQTSCESGLCATCKIRYLEGEVDHRDFILDDQEKGEYLTACVSRGVSEVIVLDL